MSRIKLVTFDALHTVITPRLPIAVQYAQVFAPHVGELNPNDLQKSFKSALKQVQHERPAYENGAETWWFDVVKRTAIGAGVDLQVLKPALPTIVQDLLRRFSSKEGYRLFDDTVPTLRALQERGLKTGLVSNADTRILSVLEDLAILPHLAPVLISEKEGVEKPTKAIFLAACARAEVLPSDTLHIGDELRSDYWGATHAGLNALLLRRPGSAGEGESKESGEDLTGVQVIRGLTEVIRLFEERGL